MKTYIEPKKEIPIIDSVDVLVIGGGPAGFSAAYNSAKLNAKTMLLEQAGSIGGVATTGLMSHWTGNTKGGFYEELIERTKDTNAGFNNFDSKIINPEKLKITLLEMLDEVGVKLKLYTFASDVIMQDNKLKGVIIESKSGRQAIEAKVVIDASGDGDTAAKAGVPFIKGRENDGKMQPMTLMFKVAGVDTNKAVFPGSFESEIQLPKGEIQQLGKEHIPFPAGHVLLMRTTLPGVVTCNMTNCIDVDGTNVDDLTKAEIICRKQIKPIIKFLNDFVPGYENCYLISSASIIGVRETRHFKGEYTLTKEDILQAKLFDDWVVSKAHFNFDVHNLTGNGLDKTGLQKHFPKVEGYTIPYRCLIPINVDNLILAGRNISGTHMAHSNYRVMPICVNMGQAAGIAGALSAKQNIVPRKIDVKEIQNILLKNGVEI